MDGTRFDAMARSWALRPRRRVLARLVGAAFAALIFWPGTDGPETAAAQATVATCRHGKTRCGGTCVDPKRDRKNCGGCGRKCWGPGAACHRGKCVVSTCPGGALPCSQKVVFICDSQRGCHCATQVNGEPVCLSTSIGCGWFDGAPFDCTKDQDCFGFEFGEVCVRAHGRYCSGCAGGCARVCG